MQIGLIGLIQSRKATMSLIILACATVALFIGKLDGVSYAAVIATIATIYNVAQHRVDIASQAAGTIINNLPPRGQL